MKILIYCACFNLNIIQQNSIKYTYCELLKNYGEFFLLTDF